MTYKGKVSNAQNINSRYWRRIKHLREKYMTELIKFGVSCQNDPDKTTFYQVIAIYNLLNSNPNNHKFPCYEAIIDAAETQIKHWLQLGQPA